MVSVVCLGEILIDQVISAAGECQAYPGGAPANVAAALARLGTPVSFIGAVGLDENGHSLSTLLKREGIDCQGLQKTAHPTRVVEVRCTSAGDRVFGSFLGGDTTEFADAHLLTQNLPLTLLKSASALITGTLGLAYPNTRAAMAQAASIIKARGGKLVIDVNWRPTFWPDPGTALDTLMPWLQQADWLKISTDEAIALFGTDDITQLSQRFPDAQILMTDGEKGCQHLLTGNVPAFSVNSIETTGAGDAFLAAFVHQLSQRDWQVPTRTELERILTFANAMGALTTLKPGAIAALPTGEELLVFLEKQTDHPWAYSAYDRRVSKENDRMAKEIERKFLVTDSSWRQTATGGLYRQGYLPTQNLTTVRVRVIGDRGYLTIKGPTHGLTRQEFEYEIPLTDAEAMLNGLCQPPLIEKRRYRVRVENHLWEVDEFLGENEGLVLAEIELTAETETFVLPSWVGEEVSTNPAYFNSNLVKNPYRSWASV